MPSNYSDDSTYGLIVFTDSDELSTNFLRVGRASSIRESIYLSLPMRVRMRVQEVIGGTNTANSLSGGIHEVFQRTDSAGARSFLTDALGSTVALLDSAGTLQTQYTFEPFGNTTLSGSAVADALAVITNANAALKDYANGRRSQLSTI